MLTRLDDGLIDHDKVEEAGLKLGKQGYFVALGAVAWAICYSNKKLTDGFIPARALDKYGVTETIAKALVSAELWDCAEDGYVVHDFHDWNPTASSVKDKRRRDRERKRVHAGFRSESQPIPRGNPDGKANGVVGLSVGESTASRSHAHAGAPPDRDGTGEDLQIVSSSDGGEPERGPVLTNGQLRHSAIALVSLWNARAVEPFIRVSDSLADKAIRRIDDALRAHPDLPWWEQRVSDVTTSAWCSGAGPSGWVADFWWMLEHAEEIASGRYRNRASTAPRTKTQTISKANQDVLDRVLAREVPL